MTRKQALLLLFSAVPAMAHAGQVMLRSNEGCVDKFTTIHINEPEGTEGCPNTKIVALAFTYKGKTVEYTYEEVWDALQKQEANPNILNGKR